MEIKYPTIGDFSEMYIRRKADITVLVGKEV